MRRFRLLASLAVLSLAVAGCGGEEQAKADQTVDVTFTGGPLQPPTLSVPAGTTVRFVFHNKTKATHEAVIGDQAFQEEHAREMEDQPHMPMRKSKDFVEVHAEKSDTLDYTFEKAGTFFIGCHEQPAGEHWGAGEKMTVTVT